ncbi:MAG: caspase family protein [Clostridia bacterium]|nr:caspase family protein [Clostridia bacterium]
MIWKTIRKAAAGVLCAALALSGSGPARAERFDLPPQLTEIGEEAFRGNTAVVEAIVPQGVVSVGSRAFADCGRLGWVTLPSSVETFGEDVFDGCAADLLIRTAPGSAAMDYAQDNLIDYQAGTAYRALLIGQTYPDRSNLTLVGPANDVAVLEPCLERFGDTPYDVTVRMNLTAAGITDAIGEVFGGAGPQDVSLLYYSGHGISSSNDGVRGGLLGADGYGYVTAGQLRAALDVVPGRKIVIIDACYSGNFLSGNMRSAPLQSRGAAEEYTNEDFTDAFISAFSARKRSTLAGEGYFVIAAAAADESSYEHVLNEFDGLSHGYFTASLCWGCGYADPDGAAPADVNANGVITFEELYDYASAKVIQIQRYPQYYQHAQVYPSGCQWFGVLRETFAGAP